MGRVQPADVYRRGDESHGERAMRRVVLLFLKHPEPGQVKTRLGSEIGVAEAAGVYRSLTEAVVRTVPTDVDLRVHFAPVEREKQITEWIGSQTSRSLLFLPQPEGDLGARLEAAFRAAFADGYDEAAVIGSDCVDLTAGVFGETWTCLRYRDCVIGPSMDEGYYLLALREPRPELFREIAWSSHRTLAQTLARAAEHGVSVHLLPTLRDVDSKADWEVVRERLEAGGETDRSTNGESRIG